MRDGASTQHADLAYSAGSRCGSMITNVSLGSELVDDVIFC